MSNDISLLQENLKFALKIVCKALPKRTTLPILKNVRLQTHDAALYLTATDLRLAMTLRVGCVVTRDIDVTLPGKDLASFVSKLPRERIDLSMDAANRVTIQCGARQMTLNGMASAEYPIISELSGKPACKVDALAFCDAVRRVEMCASNDDSRPILTGINLCVEETHMTLAAMDGVRLGITTIECEHSDSFEVVIPADKLKILGGTFDGVVSASADDTLEFFMGDGFLGFRAGYMAGRIFIIDGKLPDYSQIIPKDFRTAIKVDRADLSSMIETCYPHDSGKTAENAIDLDVQSTDKLSCGILRITSRTAINQQSAVLDCQYRGDPVTISLNANFMIGILKAIKTERIDLKLNDRMKLLVIDARDTIYGIMPLRPPRA